jgi:hypothetical protein
LHPNGFFSRDSQSGVLKLSRFGLPGLWAFITFRPELGLGRGLNQSCNYPQELYNGVSHFTCTNRDRVDSWLLVVGNQTISLTPGPSFDYNLCCKCPNGSYKVILDIYTSRPFQRYKEHLNAKCFDPYNHALNFWESWRTPKSHFRECEWRPHTSFKVGLWQQSGDHTLFKWKKLVRGFMLICVKECYFKNELHPKKNFLKLPHMRLLLTIYIFSKRSFQIDPYMNLQKVAKDM